MGLILFTNVDLDIDPNLSCSTTNGTLVYMLQNNINEQDKHALNMQYT